MEIIDHSLLIAFFSAFTIFVIYIARDFDSKLDKHSKDKLEVYRGMRSIIKGKEFYSSLSNIIKLVYVNHLKNGNYDSNTLDDEIPKILHDTRSWRRTEKALDKLENSATILFHLDRIWLDQFSYGGKIRIFLYLLAFLFLWIIPLYIVDIFYLYILWIISITGTLIILVYIYCKYSYSKGEFRRYENEFYVKG